MDGASTRAAPSQLPTSQFPTPKRRPFRVLVLRVADDAHDLQVALSPRIFNEKTSLTIGLPMTTAEYNSDNPFAVALGKASRRKTGHTSYVLCHQPKSLDWRLRKARKHSLGMLPHALFVQVCERLNQIIQVG